MPAAPVSTLKLPSPPLGGYKLAVFDMDGTLTDHFSCWVVIHEHFGSNNDDNLARYLAGEITDMEFVALDVARWQAAKGGPVTAAEIQAVLATIPLAQGALKLLRGLLAAGLDIAIVTGGLDWLAQRIASAAVEGQQIPSDQVVTAMDYAQDYQQQPRGAEPIGSPRVEIHANRVLAAAGGLLTGEGQVGVVARDKGALLAQVIKRRGLEPEQMVAVGDGSVDIVMFDMAGLGVAVPGASPEVAAAADVSLKASLTELLPLLGL